MRKVLAALSCCLLIFAGCSQPPQPSNKIVVWHWMTDRHDTLEKLAKQYQDLTHIEVSIELFAPSDAYSQKVIAAAQANVLPDIYGILDKKSIMGVFIQADLVSDLTNAMSENDHAWERSFFDKALAVDRFEPNNIDGIKPGIYGVPLDVTNMQMLYNKKLLAKAGFNAPPKTYDDFIKVTQALKRIGITPFGSGWGELWLTDCFASNYAFNIMGEEKIFNTYRGLVPYTDPDWVKVFTLFADLRDKGVLMDGIVTKGNKYAEQDFALERVAFSFNGSWAVNVYKDINPKLEYGVMLPPAIESTGFPLKIWGGAGSSFVVNKQSPNQDKAIAFLKWLTAKEQQAVLAKETHNLPSNRESLDAIDPIMEQFAIGMEQSTHPTIWPVSEDPLVIEAFDKGIQAIIIGEKTPLEVATDVEKVKQRQMAKTKKRKYAH